MKPLSILSLLFAVLFIQSCKDDPSAPVLEPYVPPILIATNTPSVKYPNDVFPLSVGNFWVYKMYFRDKSFKGWEDTTKWIPSEQLDTVYVESECDSLKYWRYLDYNHPSGSFIETTTDLQKTYKVTSCYSHYRLKNTANNPDEDYSAIMFEFGTRMARVDSSRMLSGCGGDDTPSYPYIDDRGSLNSGKLITSPELKSFKNLETIQSNLQTYTNCKVYRGMNSAMYLSVVPGIGPVAYVIGDFITPVRISGVAFAVLYSYHVK